MTRPIHVTALNAVHVIPELKRVYENCLALQGTMSGDDIWNLCILNLKLIPPEWIEKLSRARDADESEMGLSQ